MKNVTNDAVYRTKEDAVLDGIPATAVVHTASDFFCDEENTVRCAGCDGHHLEVSELDDDLNCEDCAQNALDEEQHMKDLNADWSNSRGCNMGRSW